jgi:hypothetical protein
MSSNDNTSFTEIVGRLESKKKEADGFVLKYKTRGMSDLEEYYKGVSWALDYVIKMIREPSHEN